MLFNLKSSKRGRRNRSICAIYKTPLCFWLKTGVQWEIFHDRNWWLEARACNQPVLHLPCQQCWDFSGAVESEERRASQCPARYVCASLSHSLSFGEDCWSLECCVQDSTSAKESLVGEAKRMKYSEKQELRVSETEVSWICAWIWEDGSGWESSWKLCSRAKGNIDFSVHIISEAYGPCTGFLLLVRAEHCYSVS